MRRATLFFLLAAFGCDPVDTKEIETEEIEISEEDDILADPQHAAGEDWMCGYSIKTKGGCIAGQCGFADGWADCACAGDKCTCCPSNGSGSCVDKSQFKADICPRIWIPPTKLSAQFGGGPLDGPIAMEKTAAISETLNLEEADEDIADVQIKEDPEEEGDNFSGEPANLFSTPRLVCPADKVIKNEAGCIATGCTLDKLKGLECGCVKGTKNTSGECNCCATGGSCLQTTNNICG